MKATLTVINQMQTDGVIGKYAIGGAVGATFYLELLLILGRLGKACPKLFREWLSG